MATSSRIFGANRKYIYQPRNLGYLSVKRNAKPHHSPTQKAWNSTDNDYDSLMSMMISIIMVMIMMIITVAVMVMLIYDDND